MLMQQRKFKRYYKMINRKLFNLIQLFPAFLLMELFICLFQIFRYKIIFLIVIELLLIPFFFLFFYNRIKSISNLILPSITCILSTNISFIFLYLMEKEEIINLQNFNVLLIVLFFPVITEIFIKSKALNIKMNIFKIFLITIFSIIISIATMSLRIYLINPGLILVLKLLDYYSISFLVKIGIIFDYAITYFCLTIGLRFC